MRKRFHPAEVFKISETLKQYNIKQTGFLLLGGPGENKNTVQESLCFADSLNLEAVKVTIGIRIYPQTLLRRQAVQEGLIKSHDNLLFPKFYIAKGLETWLPKTVGQWIKDRPNWMT